MSAGVALGWATEALQKGIITEQDTLVPLKFGDKDGYIQALRSIARYESKFYEALGGGAAHASSIYGGADFAMQIAGNEMAGYHTGYGGARSSALSGWRAAFAPCNGGYSIDQGLKTVDIDVIAKNSSGRDRPLYA